MKKRQLRKWTNLATKVILALAMLALVWLTEFFTVVHLPEPGAPPELYANQTHDDLRLTFTRAIDKAEKSVLLVVYGLSDTHVLSSLRKKAEQGVPVTVVCDGEASPSAAKLLGPKVNTVERFGKGLLHQKLLVIDQQQVWVGSANMTPTSLRMHGNLVAGLHHPEFAKFIQQKGESMAREGFCPNFPVQHFTAGNQEMEFWFLPDNDGAVERIKGLIETAEKTVRVAMFTWTRIDLAKAVVAAKKRGVDAQVVVDRSAGSGVGKKVVALLKKGKVPVSLSTGPGLLHHKFLYVDNRTLAHGSANWTKAAFTQNDDCFMILHDLNEDQVETMNELWEAIKIDSKPAR